MIYQVSAILWNDHILYIYLKFTELAQCTMRNYSGCWAIYKWAYVKCVWLKLFFWNVLWNAFKWTISIYLICAMWYIRHKTGGGLYWLKYSVNETWIPLKMNTIIIMVIQQTHVDSWHLEMSYQSNLLKWTQLYPNNMYAVHTT